LAGSANEQQCCYDHTCTSAPPPRLQHRTPHGRPPSWFEAGGDTFDGRAIRRRQRLARDRRQTRRTSGWSPCARRRAGRWPPAGARGRRLDRCESSCVSQQEPPHRQRWRAMRIETVGPPPRPVSGAPTTGRKRLVLPRWLRNRRRHRRDLQHNIPGRAGVLGLPTASRRCRRPREWRPPPHLSWCLQLSRTWGEMDF